MVRLTQHVYRLFLVAVVRLTQHVYGLFLLAKVRLTQCVYGLFLLAKVRLTQRVYGLFLLAKVRLTQRVYALFLLAMVRLTQRVYGLFLLAMVKVTHCVCGLYLQVLSMGYNYIRLLVIITENLKDYFTNCITLVLLTFAMGYLSCKWNYPIFWVILTLLFLQCSITESTAASLHEVYSSR